MSSELPADFSLAIKLADADDDDGAGDADLFSVEGEGATVDSFLFSPARSNTNSIFASSSSADFVIPVTTSRGSPVFPMKNIDGNGTSLSAKQSTTDCT